MQKILKVYFIFKTLKKREGLIHNNKEDMRKKNFTKQNLLIMMMCVQMYVYVQYIASSFYYCHYYYNYYVVVRTVQNVQYNRVLLVSMDGDLVSSSSSTINKQVLDG